MDVFDPHGVRVRIAKLARETGNAELLEASEDLVMHSVSSKREMVKKLGELNHPEASEIMMDMMRGMEKAS